MTRRAEGATSASWQKFAVGEISLTALSDGPLPIVPASRGFSGVDASQVESMLAENGLPSTRLLLAQNALLIETAGMKILVDCGVGRSHLLGSRRHGPDAGRVIESLKASGTDPADIDIVALTHPHHDHCWGLVDDSGTRQFPNAELAVSEDDLEFWTDKRKLSGGPTNPEWIRGARHNLLPYRDRLIPVRAGVEVAPGVIPIACFGHTVGHHMYAVASGKETLVVLGDVIHHEVLLLKHPEWKVAWDTDPEAGVRARLSTLDMLSTERLCAFGYHCPWPGRGRVVGRGCRYEWLAVE